MQIQVTLTAKWQIKDANWYKWTNCKKLVNCKIGKIIEKTLKGTKAGYYINRVFVPISELKNRIELIKETKCPF
jgi:hypothetical protein